MIKIHRVVYSLVAITCFLITTVNAQTTKTHTEKFNVDEEVNIDINTTHTNIKFETWDRNEVEVTFILETDEKIEERFKQWDFKATGNSNTVTIESNSNYEFDMTNFQFDFNVEDFDFDFDIENLEMDLENLNLDVSDLNLNIDNMVSDIMLGMNLEDLPTSPFGKDISFNGDKYEKNPEAYLKKMNAKHGTQVTEKEVDQWMEDIEKWTENIEIKIDESEISERSKEIEKKMEKWQKENEPKLKEMTKKMEKWQKENEPKLKEMTKKIEAQAKKMEEQMEKIDFEKFENFNHFDQNKSNIKKTIHIKLPKKAKLNLNVRYGEVTLAENLRNINADLNYATLSANTINGAGTEISASYAPVYVDHWRNGQLKLNHCRNIKIAKATKIDINAQGTDVIIGTLLDSGFIRSAYGDLEIQKLGKDLKSLNLIVDYGTARLYLPSSALDVSYTGNQQSVFSLSKKCKIISDSNEGKRRVVKAYNQKQNSGNLLSILANYGELSIK